MRGHLVPVGVVALLVLVPAAAALSGDKPVAPGRPGGDAAAAGEIVIFAPEVAYRDHLVHLAVAVLDPASPTGYAAHSDLTLIVTLNDELLFGTGAVHEHDGFHPFTVTPHETGVLGVWAYPVGFLEPDEDPRDQLQADRPALTLVVEDAPPHRYAGTDPYRFPLQWTQEDDPVLNLDSQHHGWVYSGLFDVFDPNGRTYLSLMPDMLNHNLIVPFPVDKLPGTVRVVTASAPSNNLTVFGEQLERSVDGVRPAGKTAYSPHLLYRDCLDDGEVLVDPTSATEGALSFPLHTDIRLLVPPTGATLDDPQGPGPYDVSFDIKPVGPASSWGFHLYRWLIPGDPLHQVTLRMPEPGAYEVLFHPDGGRELCTFQFVVLPDTGQSEAGSLHVEIEIDDDRASVHMAAQDSADQHLPHYEFDTRVVRLNDGDPGRLVWKGKLHGHGGIASFAVGQLTPGDYEVQVFPSPQDDGTAPLTAEDPRGFVYPFEIASPTDAGPDIAGEPQAAPALALGPLIAVVLLVGLAARWRRA